MNNQEILDNAPEGATHVDRVNHYWKFIGEFGDFLMCDQEGGWVGGFSPIITRSLADIKRIVELEKDLAFYKCCMLSGEVAGAKDTPSYKAKALEEQVK